MRSRTSSTSSLRSPSAHGSGPHPATPAHTPNPLNRTLLASNSSLHHLSADQLVTGLSRVRAEQGGSRASSIPPTPAPTPNPLLQVNHHMVPEQLVAGIKKIRVDEGYVDSSSFPATPAPSPFSPSPAQVTVFSPDQVAAGIQRLREESGASALSETSTGQPPTPSTTPGPGSAPPPLVNLHLGIIPELLQESIDNLQGTDEGLDSTSSPATPIQTPRSPSLSQQLEGGRGNHIVHPEQLAAGIHRLKVEEGMSSGGSSGFPSTPAPTPFSAHPGGVRPEELAAGISRLSVIEESGEIKASNNMSSQPNLSQYFGSDANESASKEEFFDNFSKADDQAAMMASCRESGAELSKLEDEEQMSQAFSNTAVRPNSLNPESMTSSSYATPMAPTPVTPIFSAEGMAYSTYASNVPITSPLPMTIGAPAEAASAATQNPPAVNLLIREEEDENLSPSELAERDLWLPSEAVRQALTSRNVDQSLLTMAVVQGREEMQDPIRNMILHYRGETEAAKRSVLTANNVTANIAGLNQLIQAGCLRAAVNLTARLLTSAPLSSQHSPTSLRIWHVRIALLLRLKQFNTVESEAAAFGNLEQNVDLYFQFYPEQYQARTGSMVPFEFRVLLAELPMHVGKPLEAMDRLYSLLATVNQILHSKEAKGSQLWVERKICVLYALANCGLQQKDYELASRTLDQVHDLEPSKANQAKVRSSQGRMFLQLGDLTAAMDFFDKAAALRPTEEDKLANLVDRSCVSIAGNNYVEALELLQEADGLSPHDPIVINNMSVCLLYLGRLGEALSLLESSLTANPAAFLHETQVLNLATLYELESSYAGQKKQSLLDLLSRHAGDGFNTACLKF